MNATPSHPTKEGMNVTLLVISDCPYATPAAHLLSEVLAEEGFGGLQVTIEVIDGQEQAEARGFLGSPSYFFDGVDLFAVPGAPAAVANREFSRPPGAAPRSHP